MTSRPTTSSRLRELDGWRAISVGLVVVAHFISEQHSARIEHWPWLLDVVRHFGSLGVKTFFVISGFVICRLLLLEEARYGKISLKAFYCRRAFRILPPLLVYLGVVSILLGCGWIVEHWRALGYSLIFLQDFHVGPRTWFVGHTWSLAVEEQFYVTFPLALVLTSRTRRQIVCSSFLAVSILWNLSLLWAGSESFVSKDVRSGFICIALGVLAALNETSMRDIARKAPWPILPLLGGAVLLDRYNASSWQSIIADSLFVPPAIALVLIASLERGPLLRQFLCCRPVQAIGLASYSIYLWQQLFTGPYWYFSGTGSLIPRAIPLLVVITAGSYLFVEKPAIRYGRSLSKKMQQPAPGLEHGEKIPLAVPDYSLD